MQKHALTEIVNHSRSIALERVSKHITGGGGGLNRFYEATTLALSGIHKTFVQSAKRVPNSSVQHLREHKSQTNTEMKQR